MQPTEQRCVDLCRREIDSGKGGRGSPRFDLLDAISRLILCESFTDSGQGVGRKEVESVIFALLAGITHFLVKTWSKPFKVSYPIAS